MNIEVSQIDSGIPIPEERLSKLPLNVLKVGESFVFSRAKRASVQTQASKIKADTGKVFTIRVIDENNCRIWRVS